MSIVIGPPSEAPYLTVGDVARESHRSVDTVRAWERSGRLPALRLSTGQRLFKREDVSRLLQQMEARAVERAGARLERDNA